MPCGHLIAGLFLGHRESTCLEIQFHWNPELLGDFLLFFCNSGAIAGEK
jgi:hypothetical protein